MFRRVVMFIVLVGGACGPRAQTRGGAGGAGGSDAAGVDARPDLGTPDQRPDTSGPTVDAPKMPAAPIPCYVGKVYGCRGETPDCDNATGFCVGCTTSVTCREGLRVCDTATKTCADCLVDRDCHDPARPICDPATKACRGCPSAAACAARSAAAPYCDAATGACAACGRACPAATPICDGAGCRACRRDADCATLPGPGVCFDDIGRCATDAEVAYVQRRSSCPTQANVSAGKGTAADPFCAPQAAVAALTASRRVIVLRGPEDLVVEGLDLSSSAAPILVVGQGKVRVTGFGQFGPTVVVRAGDVTLRGFTITSGAAVAVDATGGILRMRRMRIVDCSFTPIRTENAGFDIVNTLVARNQQGVDLGQPPPGSPHRFAFNTTVENNNIGIICADGLVVSASIVAANRGAVETFACTQDAASLNLGLQFDLTRDYHLTAASPCVDRAAGLADVPPEDGDGELRPQGAAADCGAYEFVP